MICHYRVNDSSYAYSFGKIYLEILCGIISNQRGYSLTDFLDEDPESFPVDHSKFDKVSFLIIFPIVRPLSPQPLPPRTIYIYIRIYIYIHAYSYTYTYKYIYIYIYIYIVVLEYHALCIFTYI